jgi:putative nucleotidyltransferase with HDIG domain
MSEALGTGPGDEPRDVPGAVAAIVSPVYLVGGSVRDLIMGRPCYDYDFATPLTPDEVEQRVRAAGRRPYLIGKKFGTVGLKVDGHTAEITTFRTETYVGGSRRPRVEFLGELDEDLAHRDFTINAMAMRGDELIDPCGGARDIDARMVRAVGSARARLKEDPLRMLRAARFASQLDFEVEPETVSEMRRGAHHVLNVARERWVSELDKLLVGPAAGRALRLLAETGLLRYVLPELQLQIGLDQHSPWHGRTLFEHTVGVVEAVPADVVLRWAALLHDVAKPYARVEKPGRSTYAHHDVLGAEIVERTALYLKWSTARRDEVRELVRHHMSEDSPLREADDAAKGPATR